MEEHVQVAAADDLPARERADGVDMLLAGHKDRVPVGVFVDPLASLHRVAGEELVAGDRFARNGQAAGQHACDHEHAGQQPPAAKA